MNCSKCTFYNEYSSSKSSCTICETPIIWPKEDKVKSDSEEEFDFSDWLEIRGLGSIENKITETILEETDDLPTILDTSSKISRKMAIKLAREIGFHQGKLVAPKKKDIKQDNDLVNKNKILEDRLIIQEQNSSYEISLLQDKLKQAEQELSKLKSVIPPIPQIHQSPPEDVPLTSEERRKQIAESWAKK
jgi:hypothetical protein